MNHHPTLRDFLSLERKVESLEEENKNLRACLVHIARGGKLDAMSGCPLPDIHLSVSGVGRISAESALAMLYDENEDTAPTEATLYCIAEATYHTLRQYRIPLFGSSVEGVSSAIQALHPLVGNGVAHVLNVWRALGGSPEYPAEDLHCHVPAYKVLRNKGCKGLRQPSKEVAA